MKKILADREKFKQPTEKQNGNKSITKTADKVTATYKEQKGLITMAKAKDFKSTPVTQIIQGAEQNIGKTQVKAEAEAPKKTTPQATREEKIPDGYKLNPEYIEKRTRRVQIILQPSIYKAAKKIADKRKVSFNDLIHSLLEECIKNGK